MEIERSFSPKYSGQISYNFDKWEEEAIAAGLKKEIKLLEAKIQRVVCNPKNEGQVKYIVKIENYRDQIYGLQDIIKTMIQHV